MLSCRSFYSPELEFCRRSERGGPSQLAHASRHREQYDNSEILSNRTSPLSESESKSGGVPRKRVPVACGRCRKRKIKCSGDDGNGACSNCKNAGAVHQCQFLRVNSLSQEILSHPPPRWQMGIRYSPYSTHHRGSRNNSVNAPHSYNVSGHYPAVQTAYEYNAYTGATTGTHWARSNNGAAYSYSCDEESPINYPSNSAYLPSSEPTTNSMGFALSLSGLRTWEPITHTNRGQQTAACGLQQIPGSITPTANQFISFSNSHTAISSESAFPGGLSSQTNMMTSDRVLPDPAASRSQSVAKITSIESVPMSLLHRPSNPWIETIPGSSQSSTSRTLSSGLSDGSESTSRSITSSASQDVGFGFIPISNNPQDGSVQPTAVVTAAETSQSTFECSRTPFADYSRERCRTLSSESVARQHEEALAEAYGYSGESRCDPRSALHGASSGPLSNGQDYTRLRHESSQVNSPLEEYRQNTSSYEAGIPPRTASASVNGSSSGY